MAISLKRAVEIVIEQGGRLDPEALEYLKERLGRERRRLDEWLSRERVDRSAVEKAEANIALLEKVVALDRRRR